jgi:hypothetical protein
MVAQRDKPKLLLEATYGEFDQTTWHAAADQLTPYFGVEGGLMVELAEDIAPHVVVAITAYTPLAQEVLTGVLSGALYDALKTFLRPGKKPRFELSMKYPDGHQISYVQERTDNTEVLKQLIDKFGDSVPSLLSSAQKIEDS